MGIPSFFGRFIRQYFRHIVRGKPDKLTSLCIDMNGLLHRVAQKTYHYGDFKIRDPLEIARLRANPLSAEQLRLNYYTNLVTELNELLTRYHPTHNFIICVDGVGPMAKINQQRQRRYRNSRNGIYRCAYLEREEKQQYPHTPEEPMEFDPNSISPFTPFMEEIDRVIDNWLRDPVVRKRLPGRVIYSSYRVIGEGEHKLFSLIRQHVLQPGESHLVYSLDADMFLLSILSGLQGIVLGREEENEYVYIDDFITQLKSRFMNNAPTGLDDFSIMMSFLGNDFLPHNPAFQDMGTAIIEFLRIYAKLGLPLTDPETVTIKWDNLQKYLELIYQESEPSFLLREAIDQKSRYDAKAFRCPSEFLLLSLRKDSKLPGFYDEFRNQWYNHILNPRADPEDPVIKYLTEKKVDMKVLQITPENVQDRIDELSLNYLTGVAWVYRYYRYGSEGINPQYLFRYNFGPLISDVSAYLKKLSIPVVISPISPTPEPKKIKLPTLFKKKEEAPKPIEKKTIPFAEIIKDHLPPEANVFPYYLHPIEQLIAILPPNSYQLFPEKIRWIVGPKSPFIDLFPHLFNIDMDGEDAEHKGVVILPPIEIDRLHQVMKEIDQTVPDLDYKKFEWGQLYLFDRQNGQFTERVTNVGVIPESYQVYPPIQNLEETRAPPPPQFSAPSERGRGTEYRGRSRGRGSRGRGSRGTESRGHGSRGRGQQSGSRGRGRGSEIPRPRIGGRVVRGTGAISDTRSSMRSVFF